MKLLLDTHTFLWWLDGDRSLSQNGRTAIAANAPEVFISAASAWEIATKHRLGKLPAAADVAADVPGCIRAQGFQELAVTVADGQRAGALPGKHRDPFDRMLIAQSITHDLTIISNEKLFDAYGVRRLW